MIRFLIDENLSPALVGTANELGYVAFHVVHRGWTSLTDAQLFRRMRDEDLTLVTNNWLDFEPMLRREELNAGAVVILPAVRRGRQVELFRSALEAIAREGLDMVNTALTVDARGRVTRFDVPEPG